MINTARHTLTNPETFVKLRNKGYRITAQRILIMQLLAGDTSHPSASNVLERARKKAPNISMSTVYYTLDMLKKEGLIAELEFYDRENRYDTNVINHINLICKKCGKIEDFMKKVPLTSKIIERQTGFQPLDMRFEYYGFCKKCGGRKPAAHANNNS